MVMRENIRTLTMHQSRGGLQIMRTASSNFSHPDFTYLRLFIQGKNHQVINAYILKVIIKINTNKLLINNLC